MTHSEDMQATIERLREASASLTHPRDLAVAQQYIRQLEKEAARAKEAWNGPILA